MVATVAAAVVMMMIIIIVVVVVRIIIPVGWSRHEILQLKNVRLRYVKWRRGGTRLPMGFQILKSIRHRILSKMDHGR